MYYPGSRKTCDLYWGDDQPWAIEVKMIRFRGDNGALADLSVQDILSPFEDDHSAIGDCLKLASSGFAGQKAALIYAFDDPVRPVARLLDAFEVLARHYVRLGPRHESRMNGLVHPVHASGSVIGWEVLTR